jgi:hypothetical protein
LKTGTLEGGESCLIEEVEEEVEGKETQELKGGSI